MSAIVGLLMDTAESDANLLIENDKRGDNFSIPREVDFSSMHQQPRKHTLLPISLTTIGTEKHTRKQSATNITFWCSSRCQLRKM